MQLDVLAIAAHPDDVELTCGGTLIKMAGKGYRTGILDLTQGEMGTRGSAEMRRKEAAAAARVMGTSYRECLGLPDARIEETMENKLAVARKIRELRPRVVILPYWEGRHPDHYICSRLSYEACFLAGLKKLSLKGTPFRPFKILYSTMYAEARPTFVVDITEEFERRRQAILCYKSQFAPEKTTDNGEVFLPLDTLQERVSAAVRQYGLMIGTQYAEPFSVREMIQVDDIVTMPVRSI
jgi:bacillithiol biosynthesis deacetylase BshB1